MNDYAANAECLGDLRRMLAAGAAEAAQGETRDVVTALDGDFLDRVGHALDGDPQESRRELLGLRRKARRGADVARERRERVRSRGRVERLVRVRAEHARKEIRLDA